MVATAGQQSRDKCFEEIEREDTPRPLTYQLDLMKKLGFRQVDVLHKNSCFAAFGAVK
jgi:tRNA (cmo5U34)-methyltransferase